MCVTLLWFVPVFCLFCADECPDRGAHRFDVVLPAFVERDAVGIENTYPVRTSSEPREETRYPDGCQAVEQMQESDPSEVLWRQGWVLLPTDVYPKEGYAINPFLFRLPLSLAGAVASPNCLLSCMGVRWMRCVSKSRRSHSPFPLPLHPPPS